MFNQCFAPLACLMDIEATQSHFSMGQTWACLRQATNWGQSHAQEQGLGRDGFQSVASLVGCNWGPMLSLAPRSTPLPQHLPTWWGMPRPRRKMLHITPDCGHTAPAAASCRAPCDKIQSSSSKSHAEPSTDPRHQHWSVNKSLFSHGAAPRAPIAAQQHTPSLG